VSVQRPYVPGPQRSKIGNYEIKLTKEMLSDIRNRFLAMGQVQIGKAAEELAKIYTDVSPLTIEGYIRGARVHDDVFRLYMEDKVSFTVLEDIGPMDQDTGLFLVTEMLERKLLPTHIKRAKAIMKDGDARSWDEALKKASGEIKRPIVSPLSRQSGQSRSEPRSFDDLLKDIIYQGTEWRLKVKSAIDMLPGVADQAEHSFAMFNKLYMLRHSLIEQLELVDKTVKAVLDRMVKRASSTEAVDEETVHEPADHGDQAEGGTQEGEAGTPEVHGPRQAFPDSSRQEEVH
jgi:hypothetical protein